MKGTATGEGLVSLCSLKGTATGEDLVSLCSLKGTVTGEDLVSLCSLKGTATGEDLFLKVNETLASLGLVSVTTNGAKNTHCSRTDVAGR